jgi:ABC-2 type transport system permease protein
MINFIQPVVWISLFLYLRESNIMVPLYYDTIRYTDYLISGIIVWRTITFIMSRIQKSIHSDRYIIRTVLFSPKGEGILFWSSIFSTVITAALIALVVLVAGIIVYGFSINMNNIILVLFIITLIIITHIGIAFILLSISFRFRDTRNFSFILTTVLGLISGVFFPPALFPYPINYLSYILPLTQGLDLLHTSALTSNNLNIQLLIIMGAEGSILFGVGRVLFRKQIRQFSQ